MEIELDASAKDKRLNQWVALTVVVLSIFMGLAGVKDGNIVQAMQQAQSNAVDDWNEYQATRVKLHVDEAALGLLQSTAGAGDAARAEAERLKAEIVKYGHEVPELKKKAEDEQARYDALNVHDDQFDASDALISIAISIAAVAALTERYWALFAAWVFGVGGIVMGMAGFTGASLHLGFLAQILS